MTADAPRGVADAKKISLIVCTRNRAEILPRCLAALASLRCDAPWELILVDNASTDATPGLLRDFAQTSALDVRVVRGTRVGLGAARNAAVAVARGEILAFTDDDCYPHEDFLNEVLRVFTDPDVAWAGGRILLYDQEDAPMTIRSDTTQEVVVPGTAIPVGTIQGANLAARRAVALAIGGFDPRFGPGTPYIVDDVDFVARASAAGWKGGYFPGPTVLHHHRRRRGGTAEARMRQYAYGRGAYYAKFLLDRRTRMAYARLWYWATRGALASWDIGSIGRELIGAIRYVVGRPFRRRPLDSTSRRG